MSLPLELYTPHHVLQIIAPRSIRPENAHGLLALLMWCRIPKSQRVCPHICDAGGVTLVELEYGASLGGCKYVDIDHVRTWSQA